MRRYFIVLFLMLIWIALRQDPPGGIYNDIIAFMLGVTMFLGIFVMIQDIYLGIKNKKKPEITP